MARNVPRLVWASSPGRHLLAGFFLATAGLLLLMEFDLVRVASDQFLVGSPVAPLWRSVVSLPPALGVKPFVLSPGFFLSFPGDRLAAAAALVLLPLLAFVFIGAALACAVGIETKILLALRRKVLQRMLKGAASGSEEMSDLVDFGAEILSRDGSTLSGVNLMPLRVGGLVLLAVFYVAVCNWRLAVLLVVALSLTALIGNKALAMREREIYARRREGVAIRGTLADLVHRLPAVRAHGTMHYENDRLTSSLQKTHRLVARQARYSALFGGFSLLLLGLTPLGMLCACILLDVSSGTALVVTGLSMLAALQIREAGQWGRRMMSLRPLLEESLRAFARSPTPIAKAQKALSRTGALVARDVSAFDPTSGERISGINLSLDFPAHVAVVGHGEMGPKILAKLFAGLLEPSTGRLTYDDADLAQIDLAQRARAISFAGGETVLLPDTLRANLLYGCPQKGEDVDRLLYEAVDVAGLRGLIQARGIAGTLDPAQEPTLAGAIVDSRRAVQAALAAAGLDPLVEPFDSGRYNRHATIGENLLFGKAVGDTFHEDNLAAHPFVRAVLEAEELNKPLLGMGLSIARSMIEIFADIPDGHPLFTRFSFFSASDRPYFEDLLARRTERRRGAESARERQKIIGLALRYSESRHRLGLMDEAMEKRLLTARADFAKMLPPSLKPAIEFYDADRLCIAASVQDNLLFGRIAADRAGAEAAVHDVIKTVLTQSGLDRDVFRIGLATPVETSADDLTVDALSAIDLVRCLMRQPDILIVERALDGLPRPRAEDMVVRLRKLLHGRGLILVSSDLSAAMDVPPFDAVIRMERGVPSLERRTVREKADAGTS